jgi:uncharacterized protein (TIGR02217 family)
MPFIETRFPVDISYGVVGGPGFKTDVVVVNSGFEQRNAVWEDSRCMWDAAHGLKTQDQLDTLIAFFRVMKGRANGFRFKDWTDFSVGSGEGIFRPLSGTTFQMVRRYTTAGNNQDRDISKPVSGTIVVTGGTGVSVNYTTGVVTVTSGTPTAWTGEFDVPARFDTDQMKVSIEDYNAYTWGQIPVLEIRV